MWSFWTGGRFFALTAFIVAFPSVFSNFGKTEGLKLSLAILCLYLIRGFGQLFVEAALEFGRPKDKPLNNTNIDLLHKASRMVLFSEIPMVLAVGYFGLKMIPTWLTVPYEKALTWACPFIILIEGFAAMTVILSSGQLWSEFLSEQTNFVKGVVAAICLSIYAVSTAVIVHFYYSGMISTVISASMVAIVLTLVLILTAVTIWTPHGTITDSSLVFLYSTYNLWAITQSIPTLSIRTDSNSIWKYLSQSSLSSLLNDRGGSLLSTFSVLLNIFSFEIITILIVQMAIFIGATRFFKKSNEGQDQDVSNWLITVLWPCFGRCLLVGVYTYSWLVYTRQSALPIYLDPVIWRWVNIFGCLAIYAYHLLFPDSDHDAFSTNHYHSE